MKSEELEVIVVDDHLAMRRGIELLLREAGFRIAGVAGTLDEARAILSRRRFDVALLDVQLGAESSVGLVEDLLREDPTAPIVLYTGYTGSDSMLHEAVRAGARGFVLKTSPAPRLTDALRAVAGGGTFVDPELAGQLAEDGELQRLSALSARELEVLELLADGLNGQMIAERLSSRPRRCAPTSATPPPSSVPALGCRRWRWWCGGGDRARALRRGGG